MARIKNKAYPYYELTTIKSLWNMVCVKAEEQGDKIAFRFRKGKNTVVEKSFKDVRSEVEGLREFLFNRFDEGTHIAVLGENSYEWVISFLAIASSGNVAVAVDKELPDNEISELLDLAEVKAVIASATYIDLVEKKSGIDVFSMKKLPELIEEGKSFNNAADIDKLIKPEELASIFFTSGTSGKSKGVMLSHGNIAAEINNTCKLFEPGGGTLSVLPFHHAFGLIVAVFMVFNYGYPNFINKSLKTVKADMVEAEPQTMMLVPLFVETFHRQIFESAKKQGLEKRLRTMMKLSDALLKVGIDIRRKAFASVLKNFGGNLRYIICGGAVLNPYYVKEFRSLGVEVLNGYGTTECSPCVSVNRNHFKKDGSAGQLEPEVEVKIAEDGEVLFKGPVVMMGYYKNQEATDEVLKDGWYATGDIGEVDEDNFITLTGRKKNLIILSNGENISPEELEMDLGKDEGVCEVLVYEKDNIIVAEIYPTEEFMGNEEHFEALLAKVNDGRPIYKQIKKVKLREVEFIKNTSRKIIRNKNIF